MGLYGVVLAVALAAVSLAAQAPRTVTPEASADATLPLFTVMAAVNAAADAPFNNAQARQIRQDVLDKKPPSLEDLRRFWAEHKLADPIRNYSRYVSFALIISGPPDFSFRVRSTELPADAQALDGLNPLLAAFYAEADLGKLWEKYRPAHEEMAETYQEGIARVMLEVNGYLRNATAGYLGRSFSVYIDLLGPTAQVNARSFGPDYYVVVTPSAQPLAKPAQGAGQPQASALAQVWALEEVRHGYLHYVLEPLAAKHSALMREREKLLEVAARAPALDPTLRSNFKLFLSESLIRAAELRMIRVPEADRQKRLEDAAEEGYFLAPYFYEALQKFEQQEAGIRLYYPTLVEKLDVRREERAAEKITFRATPSFSHLSETARLPAASDEVEGSLAEAEDALARRDLAAARRAYQAALGRSPAQGTARARALYGLALVATQEKQPELAKNFFQQTLEAANEPQLLAWAHIYLGRLFDMENNRDLAVRHYRQALEAGELPPGARQAAQRGLEEPFRGR